MKATQFLNLSFLTTCFEAIESIGSLGFLHIDWHINVLHVSDAVTPLDTLSGNIASIFFKFLMMTCMPIRLGAIFSPSFTYIIIIIIIIISIIIVLPLNGKRPIIYSADSVHMP